MATPTLCEVKINPSSGCVVLDGSGNLVYVGNTEVFKAHVNVSNKGKVKGSCHIDPDVVAPWVGPPPTGHWNTVTAENEGGCTGDTSPMCIIHYIGGNTVGTSQWDEVIHENGRVSLSCHGEIP